MNTFINILLKYTKLNKLQPFTEFQLSKKPDSRENLHKARFYIGFSVISGILIFYQNSYVKTCFRGGLFVAAFCIFWPRLDLCSRSGSIQLHAIAWHFTAMPHKYAFLGIRRPSGCSFDAQLPAKSFQNRSHGLIQPGNYSKIAFFT